MAMAMAMAMAVPVLQPTIPSLRHSPGAATCTQEPKPLGLGFSAGNFVRSRVTKLMRISSLGGQTSYGLALAKVAKGRRPRWSLQSGSADQQETAAIKDQTISEVKKSSREINETGPPVLTIVAGIFVAVLVFWGLWSLLSAAVGLFIR